MNRNEPSSKHAVTGTPALSGIKVVDLTRVLGGPYATQILGDHGAEIIKVEAASGDEVQWSWVAGKPLVSAGALQTLDYTDLAERAGRWSDQLGAFRQTLES